MKKSALVALLLITAIAPTLATNAWASGGSGGGGGAATGGGGGGGAATGGGGGGVKTSCSPSISLTAAASTISGVRSLTASYTVGCASKTRVAVTATNVSSGVIEWVAPSDSILTSSVWNAPLFGTTYRVDAKLYSGIGTLLASISANATTLPAPANCGPFLTTDAAAGTSLTNYDLTGSYSLVWCGGASTVFMSATNTTTGAVEWSQDATTTGGLTFATPQFNTTYRIDTVAYDGGVVLARSSKLATTVAAPPNCATITNENLSVGYWGIYPAIWVSTTAKDCGYGRTSVHMRITNLKSGLVEYESYGLPLNSLIDFEGAQAKYDTSYQVDVDVRGASNEVLDSSSRTVTTPPLR
jgi:hypothetical protein